MAGIFVSAFNMELLALQYAQFFNLLFWLIISVMIISKS